MKEYDYIIAGQGLAGSLCAWFALEKGQKPLVVDPGHVNASSKVAAGMINPVTGKRMVKSWNIDALLPFARQTYRQIEATLDTSLYHEMNLVKLFKSVKQQNDWLAKSGEPDYRDWVASDNVPAHFESLFEVPYGGVELRGAGYLDVQKFLEHFRNFLRQKELLIEDKIDWNAVNCGKDHVSWVEYKASYIVDCQGLGALNNPWFKGLPFSPVKGEILTFTSEALTGLNLLVNKGFWILPVGNGVFKTGATYDHENLDEFPTREGRKTLENKLKMHLKVPYEIVDHQAGIRPATFDIRPFVGFHPRNPAVAIFNGLGTKGVSIAPLLAWQLLNHTENDQQIEQEVNISRYSERC